MLRTNPQDAGLSRPSRLQLGLNSVSANPWGRACRPRHRHPHARPAPCTAQTRNHPCHRPWPTFVGPARQAKFSSVKNAPPAKPCCGTSWCRCAARGAIHLVVAAPAPGRRMLCTACATRDTPVAWEWALRLVCPPWQRDWRFVPAATASQARWRPHPLPRRKVLSARRPACHPPDLRETAVPLSPAPWPLSSKDPHPKCVPMSVD